MCFSAYNDVLSYQTSPSEFTTVLFKTAVTDPPPSRFMAFTTPQEMSRSANSKRLILQKKNRPYMISL